MNPQILNVLYVLIAYLIIRSLLLMGAALYRAGQTNSAPPRLLEMPTLPRFGFGKSNGKLERDDSEKLPSV